MENVTSQRFRNRKRYCCFYCNTYFYQVDAWQRHNRKHTGVEIECDDCGEMFSDHIELKSHQPNCQAHHVYSEDVYTDNLQKVVSKEHETPDSTSKQDINNTENVDNVNENADVSPDNNDTTEYDDLIGEVEEAKDSGSTAEEVDPATEAMIGIDHTVPLTVDSNNNDEGKCPGDDLYKSETSIVLGETTNSLNFTKPLSHQDTISDASKHHSTPLVDQVSPSGSSNAENQHPMSLEHSTDMNKKYQPYFCKNCGARFTRKDSVTRHLKKGTCSGKTAIVCNICGKIFPDVLELQRHFKLEHKNISIPPPMIARSILPRTSETHDSSRFRSYPYLQENSHNSRAYLNNHEQRYHQVAPNLQPVFYPNQTHSSNGYHSRETYFHSKHVKSFGPSLNGPCKKEPLYMDFHRKPEIRRYKEEMRSSLKREYDFHENNDRYCKSLKNDVDHSFSCRRYDDSYYSKNINLSEYTNNAMSSKQYYDNRFTSNDVTHRSQLPVNLSKDDAHAHRCKVCGLEFPRFEYLLTHLRKHKDVDRSSECDDGRAIKPKDDAPFSDPISKSNVNVLPQNSGQNPSPTNESNFCGTLEEREHKQPTTSLPSTQENGHLPSPPSSNNFTPTHITSPAVNPVNSGDSYTSHQEQLNILSQQPIKPSQENFNANAFDGKFRPFICENCGQRFTRKDSLVRHAKKQTCYEELVDLKCKHCDKSFRYSKCLFQHQELVHGIPPPVCDKPVGSEDEDSLSDKSEVSPQSTMTTQKPSNVFQPESEGKLEPPTQEPKHSPAPFIYQTPAVDQMKNARMSYSNNNGADEYTSHRNNFFSPHYSMHNPPQKHNAYPLPVRTNPPSIPKFMSPKEFKTEKNRPTDSNNSSQDSSYIGYSMLQPRPFQCEYCGDRFAHRHSLKRHVRRHLGIGIPCHDCGKLYRDQSEWRRHQLNIHNRRYEKYEVPSRMSFRDGLDQGLIGVLPVTNGTHQPREETDSDRSEEDNPSTVNNDSSNKTAVHSSNSASNVSTLSDDLKTSDRSVVIVTREEERTDEKDHKLKLFDFTSQGHDKDSRKSVLDSYLCSGDEVEAEPASVKTHM